MIKYGIKMSVMLVWGVSYDDVMIWLMVVFL